MALVAVRSDFGADALWHEEYPCFGARPALHSHVATDALVQPAGASPHLPRVPCTGHKRDDRFPYQDRLPGMRNRGPVARDPLHTRSYATVVQVAS